jgi:Flagellar capping protein
MSDVSSTSSGMTGAGGGSLLRITGMSTGLDVDAMVKKMMTAEQTKLDKAKQDQQTMQWKQEAYQDIIKDVKDLQSSFFDSGSSDKNILSSTNFAPFTVSGVAGATVDTSVATFTPGVGAQTGKYTIKVDKLAAGAGVSNTVNTSITATPPSTKATLATKLTDIDTSLTGNIQLVLNVNGGTSNITVSLNNTGTSTLGDLVNAINNQGSGSVKASFSELTGKFKLNTATAGESTSLIIKSGTAAKLSSVIGFTAANNGTTTTADWTVSKTSTDTAAGTIETGQNAIVRITPPGGTEVTLTDKTSNNFTIDGMNYILSSESTATVNVGSDTTKVYDKIKGFIDKYNTIVDKIQTDLTEKKSSSYKPLTDAQKESMSSSQITAWETKAKVGILRNDSNLQKMLTDLRSAFTTAVSNTGFSMGKYSSNSIGLDTSDDYAKPGHIDIVDSSKLKAAISSNSNQILKMFTNVSAATDGSTTYSSSTTQYKEDGIFTRIKSILQTNVGYTNTTLNTAILTAYANKQYDYSSTGISGKNTIPDQLYKQELMIKKITTSMSTKQEQYYKKFSQLETAMTTLNAQQSQLSSLTG